MSILKKYKKYSSSKIATMMMLVPMVLFGCEVTSSADSAESSSSAVTESTNTNGELLDSKPEVAEVETNNVPNRIITTLNGNPQTQIGFNIS
ncbi:hypothetical protein [Desemzia sp. FAM 23989]|uniref:hypothetical protein n=1 Tax=Desemzia sp. FAM 23989 TaxID=3259523 RepID=UPI0038839CB2